MKINFALATLLLTIVANGWQTSPTSKQAQVIELAAKGDPSKTTTLFVNDEHLLLKSGKADDMLFGPESLYLIDHKNRTYRAHSYEELLQAISSRYKTGSKPDSSLQGDNPSVELKLTEETETIAGFRTRKVVELRNGKVAFEMWVCRELTPAPLNRVAEKIMATLPKEHWSKVQGRPGMAEMIMMFGIPLKMVAKADGFEAQAVSSKTEEVTAALFQVPAGYQRVDK